MRASRGQRLRGVAGSWRSRERRVRYFRYHRRYTSVTLAVTQAEKKRFAQLQKDHQELLEQSDTKRAGSLDQQEHDEEEVEELRAKVRELSDELRREKHASVKLSAELDALSSQKETPAKEKRKRESVEIAKTKLLSQVGPAT